MKQRGIMLNRRLKENEEPIQIRPERNKRNKERTTKKERIKGTTDANQTREKLRNKCDEKIARWK